MTKKMFFIKAKKENKQSGFTLIELMTSITLFTFVMTATMGIFLGFLSGSRKVSGQHNILDSGRFIMETMVKEIRMSTVLTSGGGPFSVLSIINSKGQTVNFIFDSSAKKVYRQAPLLSIQDVLNPDEIEITATYFYVQKTFGIPARVTLSFSFRSISAKATEQAVINLQNTVSSRQYIQEAER